MKAGEEKEIEVVYDDDYPDPVFAGARIKYLCRVKAVKEPILPPFDDALARRTGKVETALELRLKLREDLNRQQHDQLRKIHKNQVVRQVVERNQIPVPEAMVNDYLDAMVADARQNDPGLDESEVRESGREVAANTLRWNMLFHHIAGQEKIEVSPADTEQVIKSIADDHQVTPEQARQALERSGQLASLRDAMLEEKVLDFLVDRARVVPVGTGKKK
jgi:trigger factor